jgi:hypothetical protein
MGVEVFVQGEDIDLGETVPSSDFDARLGDGVMIFPPVNREDDSVPVYTKKGGDFTGRINFHHFPFAI